MRYSFLFAISMLLSGVSHANLLFQTDMESADSVCWATRGTGGWNEKGCNTFGRLGQTPLSLSIGERAFSGTKSLKINFNKDEEFAGATKSIPSTRHVFVRYYDWYNANFDFPAGMKIQRLSGKKPGADVFDFDIIVVATGTEDAGKASSYCNINPGSYINVGRNAGPVDWGQVGNVFNFATNKWLCVETEIKLNDPGVSNGEVRLWIDGKMIAEKKNANLIGSLATGITDILFGGWYSNGVAGKNPCVNPGAPSIRYIDDMVIADTYIGPVPAVAAKKNSAAITFQLPYAAQIQVEYGATAQYGGKTATFSAGAGQNTVTVSGLTQEQAYHYRIVGTFASTQAYQSPDYSFTTTVSDVIPGSPVNLPPDMYRSISK